MENLYFSQHLKDSIDEYLQTEEEDSKALFRVGVVYELDRIANALDKITGDDSIRISGELDTYEQNS